MTSIRVGDWVMWSNYVCKVINVEDILIIRGAGFNYDFRLSTYRSSEMTVITEEEAAMLILKGHTKSDN